MNYNCNNIAIGQPLSSWQQRGLKLVSLFDGGRDVVFAIDLTDSVGLNDEGRIRLTQIIEDSLNSGDTVYVVPFASTVNPLAESNSFNAPIQFRKQEDINSILAAVPFESDERFRNTDIQQAEAYIYPQLAQLNQCRMVAEEAIKPQSVIWLTDAPLFTDAGINSDVWVETPADSPFRVAGSEASIDRNSWIEALPLNKRSQTIQTDNNQSYQLTVVDVAPTVQEFCTPSPGSKDTCLVNAYIAKRLLPPGLILLAILGIIAVAVKRLLAINKKWRLKVSYLSDDSLEKKTCYLENKGKIAIEAESFRGISCPGNEIRGYIVRKGTNLYLKPTKNLPLYYGSKEVLEEILVTGNTIKLNCPDKNNRDFEILITVIK